MSLQLTQVKDGRIGAARPCMPTPSTPIEVRMQLVCPAGNLPALQAAIDNGADAVYAGFQDRINARAVHAHSGNGHYWHAQPGMTGLVAEGAGHG